MVSTELPRPGQPARARRLPAATAVVLVVLGILATAVRMDAPSDGTIIELTWSQWRPGGVVVTVPDQASGTALHTGDVVTGIAGHRLADGLGGVARPAPGSTVRYDLDRPGGSAVDVVVRRPDPYPLLDRGWGNLVFVLTLGGLALALYLRRPDEPATGPLLVFAAGLLGSTLAVVAGLPALALATGGAQLWLFHLNAIGAYSLAWGAGLAFSLTVPARHPWLRRGRHVLTIAYLAPLAVVLAWSAVAALLVRDPVPWLGLVHSGQTAVVAASLLTGIVSTVVAYRGDRQPATRARLRWLAGGAAASSLVGIAGWQLPELVTGRQPLPWGALGLSVLPFVGGIAVALRRHRLFDIERLANRSLVYAATIAVLVAGYAAAVGLLVGGLRLSGTVAAALAATAAALALAPLRNAAQGAVNRLMYGDRQDPASALARLGARLHAVMLPADVLPAVVETVARSLRVPYAGIELADGAGGYQMAAEHGDPVGAVHLEPLVQHGTALGRLRVSARGRDDPLDAVDLGVVGSLARQVGPAVQAVRLHNDLVRSRAEIVALREDERRRLRRDLHDGLAPTLAAIGLKADLAARDVPAGSTTHGLLGEISAEARASIADVRRLVEALRPPALDELGLVPAVRSRAAALAGGMAGGMAVEVTGTVAGTLPAAVETAAYRIAVEAITNAVRHSGGRHCAVTIASGERGVEVTVRDDGRGLDPARAAGVGLRSMRERADEVGGAWSVRSLPEGGTLVHACLPTGLGGPDDPADPRR